ncbi:MAG: hypothetical protein J4O07_11215, partial [Chloroflexi bacterium]|nr:hypothetical protein [Chloroflexota bacterium]MCI0872368.1 hypothetical protein [Chloroflexota bacterium]
MAMDNRTKTKSTSTVRNGRFNLSFGISIRSITRAIKRSAAPTGLMLLAFSTACAPIAGAAHVNA